MNTITFSHFCISNVAIQYGKVGIHDQNARRSVRPHLSDSESPQVKRKFEEEHQPRKVPNPVIPAILILLLIDKQHSSSDDRAYVLKPVSPAILEQIGRIGHDLQKSQFVRLPVDTVKDESTLVYQYFTKDLMSFIKKYEISMDQTKRLLLNVLKGLKELHDHSWVHTG